MWVKDLSTSPTDYLLFVENKHPILSLRAPLQEFQLSMRSPRASRRYVEEVRIKFLPVDAGY